MVNRPKQWWRPVPEDSTIMLVTGLAGIVVALLLLWIWSRI